MNISGVAVQKTAEFVKIRPENSMLWTVISITEYKALLPDCNMDPGYCLKKTIKTKKLTSVTDFQLGKMDIFFRDNQVWLDFYKLHPSKYHKDLFERFSMTKKDIYAECWTVSVLRGETFHFQYKHDAEQKMKEIDRNRIATMRYQKIVNPKSVKSVIKLPFVPFCLDNYDIARIWQSWFLTDLEIEIDLQTLITIIEVIKNGKESC